MTQAASNTTNQKAAELLAAWKSLTVAQRIALRRKYHGGKN